jgi:hypothetical protein
MVCAVKIVVQVKLLPDARQAPALEAALRAVNDAANLVSAVAFGRRVFREYELRKHAYGGLKGPGARRAGRPARDQEDLPRLCDPAGEHPGGEPRQPGVGAAGESRVGARHVPARRRAAV